MQWRSFLASALLGFSIAFLGCECEETYCEEPYGYRDPTMPRAIEAVGRGEMAVARAQAADDDQPVLVAQVQKPPSNPPGRTSPPSPPSPPDDGFAAAYVRAKVNGEAILDEELRAATFHILRSVETMPEPDRSKRREEIWTQALNSLIEREVVLQDAFKAFESHGNEKNREKIQEMATKEFEKTWKQPLMEQFKTKTDEEFKAILKSEGMSLEMQKRMWERNFMAQQYLQSRVWTIVEPMLSHMHVMEYYNNHPEEFKLADEVQWQDLFVAAARHASPEAAKRFAEVLAQRMRQGEDFVKLSEQFDDGDSKYRKGEGIGRKKGEIKPPEMESLLFSLRDGNVAVYEQSSGFHVVRVVKRQQAGLMPFDDKTQKLIRDKIRNENMDREIKMLVTELKRKAVIEVFK